MSLLAGLFKCFRFLATWLLRRRNFHALCLYTREGTELNFENNYHSIKEWHQIKKLAQTSCVPDSGSLLSDKPSPRATREKFNNENYCFSDLTAEFILYTFIDWKESFHRKNTFPIDWRASEWLCWCRLDWLFIWEIIFSLKHTLFHSAVLFSIGKWNAELAYLEWEERIKISQFQKDSRTNFLSGWTKLGKLADQLG